MSIATEVSEVVGRATHQSHQLHTLLPGSGAGACGDGGTELDHTGGQKELQHVVENHQGPACKMGASNN